MRLLVLTSTFPSGDDDRVPGFVKEQVVALKASRPDVSIAVLAPHSATSLTKPFTRHAAFDEYRFHYVWPFRFERLAGNGIMPTLKRNPAYYAVVPLLMSCELVATVRLAWRLKADVIYAHWFTPQGMVAWAASKVVRRPFVYTSHSSDVAVLRKVPVVGRWIVRRASRDAAAITVVSRRSLEKLKQFFGDAEWPSIAAKTRVVPMGVNVETATETGAPAMLAARAPIVFVGRLVEKKGVQYLLPAYAKLIADVPGAPALVVAGSGPWSERLEAMADALQLPSGRVTFPGFVAGEAKRRLLAEAGMIIVPSTIAADGDAEGLPVALLEGLAAGKVCVATKESGADDVLTDRDNGLLVDHQDVDALAAAMKTALAMDEQATNKMCRSARETARQFSWPAIAARHDEHLFRRFATLPSAREDRA